MKNIKKTLRLVSLVFFIALALSGLGGIGIFSNRERYQDKVITIEMVDKKEEESETEMKDLN